MILSIKGALEETKKHPEDELFYGAFIVATLDELEKYGIKENDIYDYKFNFITD